MYITTLWLKMYHLHVYRYLWGEIADVLKFSNSTDFTVHYSVYPLCASMLLMSCVHGYVIL